MTTPAGLANLYGFLALAVPALLAGVFLAIFAAVRFAGRAHRLPNGNISHRR